MKISNFIIVGCAISLMLMSCQKQTKKWTISRTIDLGKTTPIGLTVLDDHIWVSDGDNNQLVHLDASGKILFTESDFERPMHITTDGEFIYVPEYGRDQISIFKGAKRSFLPTIDSLDAPAGIHYHNGKFAIADFYNHRILFGNEEKWISFGKEGKTEGEFYYPTDVHITANKIFVADAYNNRVQVFNHKGKFLSTFGKEEKLNAATGIFVSDEEVFITDFEHDRVLSYSHDGKLNQIIETGLSKPTDVFLNKEELIITNYKGKNLSLFTFN